MLSEYFIEFFFYFCAFCASSRQLSFFSPA
jgi:hypothetical protein